MQTTTGDLSATGANWEPVDRASEVSTDLIFMACDYIYSTVVSAHGTRGSDNELIWPMAAGVDVATACGAGRTPSEGYKDPWPVVSSTDLSIEWPWSRSPMANGEPMAGGGIGRRDGSSKPGGIRSGLSWPPRHWSRDPGRSLALLLSPDFVYRSSPASIRGEASHGLTIFFRSVEGCSDNPGS